MPEEVRVDTSDIRRVVKRCILHDLPEESMAVLVIHKGSSKHNVQFQVTSHSGRRKRYRHIHIVAVNGCLRLTIDVPNTTTHYGRMYIRELLYVSGVGAIPNAVCSKKSNLDVPWARTLLSFCIQFARELDLPYVYLEDASVHQGMCKGVNDHVDGTHFNNLRGTTPFYERYGFVVCSKSDINSLGQKSTFSTTRNRVEKTWAKYVADRKKCQSSPANEQPDFNCGSKCSSDTIQEFGKRLTEKMKKGNTRACKLFWVNYDSPSCLKHPANVYMRYRVLFLVEKKRTPRKTPKRKPGGKMQRCSAYVKGGARLCKRRQRSSCCRQHNDLGRC